MLQVMGVFLAESDVGADAAIQIVMRIGGQQRLQMGRQQRQAFEQPGADLEMNADPPCPGVRGEQPGDEQQQKNQKWFLRFHDSHVFKDNTLREIPPCQNVC